MRYDKQVSEGYIVSISTSNDGAERDGNITKEQYEDLSNIIHSRPVAVEGCMYLLREDLSWEMVEMPEVEDEAPMSQEELQEALDMILSGVTE